MKPETGGVRRQSKAVTSKQVHGPEIELCEKPGQTTPGLDQGGANEQRTCDG